MYVIFGANLQKFEDTSSPQRQVGHRGLKEGPKHGFMTPKTTQNHRSKQGLHSDCRFQNF